MKLIRTVFVLLLAASFALPCGADIAREYKGSVTGDSSGEVLFGALVERLDPDSMEMVVDEEPSEDGRVRHMYIKVQGARFGGFRLEEMVLETAFSKFNPISQWKDAESIVVEDIMSGNFTATILEEDINSALKEQIGDHWRGVLVDIRPDGLFARGYYVTGGGVSLKILVDLSTKLEVRSKKIWLKDYALSVNNAEKTGLVEEEVRNLQPVVDLEDFVFPLSVDRIEMGEKSVKLVTKTAPQSFDGIRFKYDR
ncbi:MAG: DUF2993 domain-containing protein [Thermovirga sp.]